MRRLDQFEVPTLLKKLAKGDGLNPNETAFIFRCLMGEGEITDSQIGSYLFSTASRKVTSEELAAGATALRKSMLRVDLGKSELAQGLLDTCGTGGSGYNTFNTSTAVGLLLASVGQPVAKHGNRSSTSKCGSADVLKALGVNLDASVDIISRCLRETNFCFMFAPAHHPATKRVVGIRKELGFRTIFNFLGPLANPAGATYQLLGVSNPEMVETMAEALVLLGTKRALVVSAENGLDEITICGPTRIAEIAESKLMRVFTVSPEEFGIDIVPIEALDGGTDIENAKAKFISVLGGEPGPLRQLVALNAGAALYITGHVDSIKMGMEMASGLLTNQVGLKTLRRVVEVTNS